MYNTIDFYVLHLSDIDILV